MRPADDLQRGGVLLQRRRALSDCEAYSLGGAIGRVLRRVINRKTTAKGARRLSVSAPRPLHDEADVNMKLVTRSLDRSRGDRGVVPPLVDDGQFRLAVR